MGQFRKDKIEQNPLHKWENGLNNFWNFANEIPID